MREKIRSDVFGRFRVTLYDTGTYDKRGQTGLAWDVKEDGEIVAKSGKRDLVYGSPLHADDSLDTMVAAVNLIVHGATHDEDDDKIEPEWDAGELGEEVGGVEMDHEHPDGNDEDGDDEDGEDDEED